MDLNPASWAMGQFVSALQQHCCDIILTYWHKAIEVLLPLNVTRAEQGLRPRSQQGSAGNLSFSTPLEIQTYKDPQKQKPSLRKFWRDLEELVSA